MTRNQSIISAIVGAILAAIMLLQSFGVQVPVVDETQLTAGVTGVITVVVWAYQLWRNHNFTDAALAGQEVIDAFKLGEKIEELQDAQEDATN